MDKPGERSVLALAGGMAFLAGATDVYGLAKLHDLYVSFMSGNTTQLGVSLGGGDFARAGSIAVLIGLFVLGAAGGAVLFNIAGRFHTATVILIVSIILLEPIVIRDGTAFAFVLAMGLLNASISRVGAASVSLTFVTGALVKFGQGLGNWITGHRSERLWGLQAVMWASLLAGSCAAAVLRNRGVVQPWPLPLAGLLLTVVAFALAPASTTVSRPAGRIR
jgi:uncharacterized membrane protein YoaK (UPF0700 family)